MSEFPFSAEFDHSHRPLLMPPRPQRGKLFTAAKNALAAALSAYHDSSEASKKGDKEESEVSFILHQELLDEAIVQIEALAKNCHDARLSYLAQPKIRAALARAADELANIAVALSAVKDYHEGVGLAWKEDINETLVKCFQKLQQVSFTE